MLQEHLAHLGTWMPFGQASLMLQRFAHVQVSRSTAQRHTEAIGLAYEAVQVSEVAQIEQEWPDVPAGPAKLALGIDGAFVPLVHGEWAEVKTLVVGEVGEPAKLNGEQVVSTHTLSYFSRLSDAQNFQRLTLAELYRRRVETAGQVAALSDGAEWIQGFVDYHCPEALRILDFPHAAERICQIGEVVLGAGRPGLERWRREQLHHLKHEGPAEVVEKLRSFTADHLSIPPVAENLAYLEKRIGQMQYPSFEAQGWPIGSGIAESANKLVVEVRLKGAGMHWARASVNPMLSLRNAVCNDRWDEAWQQSSEHMQRVGIVRRPVQPKGSPTLEPLLRPPAPEPPLPLETDSAMVSPSRPATKHPWRQFNNATKAQLAQTSNEARR